MALQQCITELKEGGQLKLFIDGLYLPSASRTSAGGGPRKSTAADAIHPFNRFQSRPAETGESSEDKLSVVQVSRLQVAYNVTWHVTKMKF